MTQLSDDEMIWLNALADDELVGADKRLWLERIQNDAEAMAAYECILTLKSNLKKYTIKPLPSTSSVAPDNKLDELSVNNHGLWSQGLWRLAASLLFVLFLGGTTVFWFDHQSKSPLHLTTNENEFINQSPIESHIKLSQSNYELSTVSSPRLAFVLDKPYLKVPDLKPSGLVLVASKLLNHDTEKKVQLLHYMGSRGCRLTLWYGPIPANDGKIRELFNSKKWTVKDTQIWVIATGMDQKRFVSITDHIELFISPAQPTQQLLASKKSMDQVYKEAESCT